ncbi:regulator of DNA class I crossover intermediates 1 [Morphnus guianensis]
MVCVTVPMSPPEPDCVRRRRSRIILKQERRKQKEFFEKKKLKSKLKLVGVSSPKSSAVSLDLLNLYVVNQISTKKDNTENMRKPVHIDITEDVKIPVRRHNIELPVSPLRTQHRSNLDDSENRLQKQVLDSRRQHLSEKVKYQHNRHLLITMTSRLI